MDGEEKRSPNADDDAPEAEAAPQPRAGQIPVPPERSWDAEPADPYDGMDRRDPFAGRPKTAMPQLDDLPDDLGSDAPGQPLPKRHG